MNKAIQVTGALMTAEIYDKVRNAFDFAGYDKPELLSAYGSTELGSVCFRPGLFDSEKVKKTTVGRINPAPGYAWRIRNQINGDIISSKEKGWKEGKQFEGEIEVLSPIRMRGYRNQLRID